MRENLIDQAGIRAITDALKVNMTLTIYDAPSPQEEEDIVLPDEIVLQTELNDIMKFLFYRFSVKKDFQERLGSDLLKKDVIPLIENEYFIDDGWNNHYWEEMNNISSLSRFVNYLDTLSIDDVSMISQDRVSLYDDIDRLVDFVQINKKKKIKRRILFLKRNKIENHVPARLNELVQNALYNDVRQQQIENIGRRIYDIQLRLQEDRDIRKAGQRGTSSKQQTQAMSGLNINDKRGTSSKQQSQAMSGLNINDKRGTSSKQQSQSQMFSNAKSIKNNIPIKYLSEDMKKSFLGDRLYPMVQKLHPKEPYTIIDMILKLDNTEIEQLINNENSLKKKINQLKIQ